MPLAHSRSKKAFTHNLKAEIEAGKPMKQSLAIAYNMKKRPKKMSRGGAIAEDDKDLNQREPMPMGGKVANGGEDELSHMADSRPNNFDDLSLRDDLSGTNSGAADGDFLGNEREDEDRNDIVDRVMRKRMKQHNPRPA